MDANQKEADKWQAAEEEADALALGMSVEEARQKTASKAALRPSGGADVSEWHMPGGHDALPQRAKKVKTATLSRKSHTLPRKSATLSDKPKPEAETYHRPPSVAPHFAVEIFGEAAADVVKTESLEQ
ncbi:uncharacterized protein MYCGRDRAFT_103897 [Zymoseptoria tritici IPO323]|nr:uncharacterized protein MYCGRDRAFT_103897 [Zymoseptoria tritici IPO323]EGP89000.1 hypothetical protein MYCGRDRAFT_103897 [Zymoseptoria tritici IPO323]